MNFLTETGIVVERLAKCRDILVSEINIERDNFYVKRYLYEKLECENFASSDFHSSANCLEAVQF